MKTAKIGSAKYPSRVAAIKYYLTHSKLTGTQITRRLKVSTGLVSIVKKELGIKTRPYVHHRKAYKRTK
jgi:hypothetical protein